MALAISTDFGDGWMVTELVSESGQAPALAVRDAVIDDAGVVLKPELLYLAWEDNGQIMAGSYDPVAATFSAPVGVGAGTSPDIALGLDSVHVAFADGGTIRHSASFDGAATFAEPAEVDPQTGELFASWEDRRGGANVYFATSDDGGQSWSPNVDVGAGLGGDQFHPQAVVDVASNVYVAFQDTTDGQKVVFSRFNEEGTFDPPLASSTKAGQEGIVGDYPSVATDLYGTVYVAWEDQHAHEPVRRRGEVGARPRLVRLLHEPDERRQRRRTAHGDDPGDPPPYNKEAGLLTSIAVARGLGIGKTTLSRLEGKLFEPAPRQGSREMRVLTPEEVDVLRQTLRERIRLGPKPELGGHEDVARQAACSMQTIRRRIGTELPSGRKLSHGPAPSGRRPDP